MNKKMQTCARGSALRFLYRPVLHLFLFANLAMGTPLQDLLAQYRKNSPTLRAEASSALAVREQAKSAGTYAAPEIGFEWGSKAVAPATSNESMYYGGITLGQEFMFPGKREAMKRAEASRADMAQADVQTVQQHGAFQIATTYLDLYMIQQRTQVLDSSLQLLASILESARRRFATGITGMEDVFRLQAELARLHSDSISLAGEERTMHIMLCANVGSETSVPISAQLQFADSLTSLPNLETILAQSQQRPELASMNSAIQMESSEAESASLRKMPDLMLQGRYMAMMGPPEWSLMVGMKIPIAPWSSAEIYSAQGAAKARTQEAEARKQTMNIMITQEVRQAWTRLETAQARVQQIRLEQITAAENALQAAMTSYRNGKSDLTMSLDATRMALMAKEELVMAKTAWLQAILSVEKSAGVQPATWLPETTVSQGVSP